ncbi:Ctr copper transporter [Penicillium expansum]|uniref:Copper transport protein n=1 Tax=Penicillium expansum TaxID=27334 RepID=A0A0A2ILX5_PENEN|nr:Ctr copper transporter [Penicillium expansum]KGO37634.1 Ctr copper transporter [Penicillium expansum]KGO41220.1 Ctr copper transporter [Penicillium expansum]KGO50554.1 Ctr copper transporter [Penicillium expansum]
MPLDTSTTYPLTRLRLDGRRWNELRLLQAQISTNPASSGSSYLSMGNTSIMCSVHGPAEGRRGDGGGGAAGSGHAVVEVDVNVAGFAGVDRKRRAGGSDRQSSRIATTLRSAFQSHLHTYLYPHSTISIHVSVLSADGSLLAAAINACTLALVDAGIPMPGLLCGCTAGMSGSASTPRDPRHDELDPLLDLSLPEEQELPSLTVATTTAVPVGENNMDEDEEAMKFPKVPSQQSIMDMHEMTMSTATSTASAAMASSTGMDMSGMDMGNSCKISMLWNWYTVDACFLANSWHIKSRGMFAGSCIGVICLVLSLELLRRLGREYDSFIVRRARLRRLYLSGSSNAQSISNVPLRSEEGDANKSPSNCCGGNVDPDAAFSSAEDDVITPVSGSLQNGDSKKRASVSAAVPASAMRDVQRIEKQEAMLAPYRPSLVEHTVRSLMHMAQFAVAYIIMLLAMYFNGYIIICIFIGAFLGAFIFSWEPVNLNQE